MRGWYDDDGNLLPGAPGGTPAWATNPVEGSGSTSCSLPDDGAAAHQCWLCGKPGRVAADDGFGWSWVPADGGAWYHCDGCGVSWRPGGLTEVTDGGQAVDGATVQRIPAADHAACCRQAVTLWSASPAAIPGPQHHRTRQKRRPPDLCRAQPRSTACRRPRDAAKENHQPRCGMKPHCRARWAVRRAVF